MLGDSAELDRTIWELAASLAGWRADYAALGLLTIRWVGLASFAPGFSSHTVSLRMRMTLAVLMASVMTGAMPPNVPIRQMAVPELAWILTAEFLIGAALGLCVGLWIAAARSAGEWIALLSGLNMQTSYQPDWDGDSGELPTPIGRLFTLLGMVIFFAGRGPLHMMDLVAASLSWCPLGEGIRPIGLGGAAAIFDIVGEALAVSILVAWPIILALAIAQMAVGIATKSRSVALSWSLLAPTRLAIGMFLLAAGFVTASVSLKESQASWYAYVERSLVPAKANHVDQPEESDQPASGAAAAPGDKPVPAPGPNPAAEPGPEKGARTLFRPVGFDAEWNDLSKSRMTPFLAWGGGRDHG